MSRWERNSKWVSGVDLMLQNTRYIGYLGGFDVPPQADIEAALRRVAEAGLHTRVAMEPAGTRRRWRRASSPLTVSRVPADVAEGGPDRLLEYIRNRPGTRAQVEVHMTDDQLVVDTQHGLGDGRLFVDLVSALVGLAGGEEPRWVTTPDTRGAAFKALVNTFARQPKRLRDVVAQAQSLRAAYRPEPDHELGSAQPWSPSWAVETAHLDAEAEAEVEKWRKTEAPGCGSGAVWLYATRRALAEAGLPMTGRVQVAFDCRRYLRKGMSANGNFATGVELPVDVDAPVSVVGARMREVTGSALPIAFMSAASAYVQLRPQVAPPVTEFVPNAPARVMYSDMGRLAPCDGFPWRASGSSVFAGLLDPSGPDGVTVLNGVVNRERTLSISFHDNVFDRATMNRAAKLLADEPLRLIAGG